MQAQTADLDPIFAGKTAVKQLPQQARFEIRRDILLLGQPRQEAARLRES